MNARPMMRTLVAALLSFVVFPAAVCAADLSFQIVDKDKVVSKLDFDSEEISVEVVESLGGNHAVQIKLPPSRLDEFERITALNTGRTMRIVVGGAVVADPTILEPISGEYVHITGLFSREEAQALADQLD